MQRLFILIGGKVSYSYRGSGYDRDPTRLCRLCASVLNNIRSNWYGCHPQPSHAGGGAPNGRHMVLLRTSHVSASIFLGKEVAQPSAKGTSKTTSPLS